MTSKPSNASTVDAAEIEKFSRMADEWWDPHGKFRPLHQLNPTRIAYIQDIIKSHFTDNTQKLSLLDVGCGGGLVAEPMANTGLDVTAIDASEKNIHIASLHAERSNTAINYQCTTVESLSTQGKQFDIVLALEIIEHVADVPLFLAHCTQLVKPGGLIFISTLNKTLKSYALAIIGAEYILRWLPIGTHEWNKFLAPADIGQPLEKQGFTLHEVKGMSFNPLRSSWSLSKDTSVNYILTAIKGNT